MLEYSSSGVEVEVSGRLNGEVTEASVNRLDLLERLGLSAEQSIQSSTAVRTRIAVCDRCHHSSLHSNNSFLPVLQGQNAEYLLAKLLMFRDSRDSFHPLRGETETLTNREAATISRYYASQDSTLQKSLLLNRFESMPKPTAAAATDLLDCVDCHGADGNGNGLIPAISGQNENYLGYRLREIANNSSKVHVSRVAAIECRMPALNLSQSRQLARQLAMVLEPERVARGQRIYRLNCARCHDRGEQNAPRLSDKDDWVQRVRRGTRKLVNSTVMDKMGMPLRVGSRRLSRNQLTDAVHYMLHHASRAR